LEQPRIHIRWYILADVLVSVLTWLCFYYLRTVIYHYPFSIPPGFYLGLLLYTLGWVALHFLTGSYNSIYQKSRINELLKTVVIGIIGCLFLLFFFILKNPQSHNQNYYLEFYSLLFPYIILTGLVRLVILNIAKKQVENGKVFFNTLLVGSFNKSSRFLHEFASTGDQRGFQIKWYFDISGEEHKINERVIDLKPGTLLSEFIRQQKVEEVIIAVEKNERSPIAGILQELSDVEVNIKIIPDTLDIISGALKTNNVLGIPLIDVHSGQLPEWQQNFKRAFDVVVSFIGMVILSPLFLYCAIRVCTSSKGTIIFRQERVGYKGRLFTMYKFRSMYSNAEDDGPKLSSENDGRITRWGRVMRKWRLDELPQLWNILKGEMSLVGPRPERKFYADQLVAIRPEFKYIYKVKPGLTSWGMVKFGYASSIDDMLERMNYDLLYVENISLPLDFKILLYTIKIIFSGTGR